MHKFGCAHLRRCTTSAVRTFGRAEDRPPERSLKRQSPTAVPTSSEAEVVVAVSDSVGGRGVPRSFSTW